MYDEDVLAGVLDCPEMKFYDSLNTS